MQTNSDNKKTAAVASSIQKLQQCYRNELSALETYEIALKSVTHVGLHHTLQEILVSHGQREERLGKELRAAGAELPPSSGAWGLFAKAFQTGADLFGDRAAIAALEHGEEATVALYKDGLDASAPATRRLLTNDLLPMADHTRAACETLRSYTAAPS
jgi:hypothetical protein